MKEYAVRLFTAVITLTAIDQFVKHIISRFFFQTAFDIIPGVLAFNPVQNTDMSWFGSLGLKVFANYYVTVIFNLIIFAAAVILCEYVYVKMKLCGKLTQAIFIFLFAGVLCSTIDRIFWKGSIDYIRLEGFFTFDIKDCYITVFSMLIIFSSLKHRDEWKQFSVGKVIKDICGKA